MARHDIRERRQLRALRRLPWHQTRGGTAGPTGPPKLRNFSTLSVLTPSMIASADAVFSYTSRKPTACMLQPVVPTRGEEEEDYVPSATSGSGLSERKFTR